MPAVHQFAKADCLCSLGRVWRKKELICPEKDYTLILFGGLALSLIISGFFEGQGIKTTGVIRTLACLFNGFGSADALSITKAVSVYSSFIFNLKA